MLIINGLTIILRKDSRVLLKDFNFVLNKNDKVAIIGEEGNGKSTLLKVIYNSNLIDEYCSYSGSIQKQDLKIGYLEQSLDEKWASLTINEYFLKTNPQSETDFNKYDDLNKMANILIKLHLDPSMAYSDQLMGTLSGGEKVKIQLAKIIVNDIDILLLDEPTNDLDIETLKWLETFINESLIR
jgi:ATPase subunit of ABC transporter with duplicated ATPase domains